MKECTLCYVIEGRRILMAEIKQGFSKGKINGLGGKLKDGETPEEAAAREMYEEIGIVPKNMTKAGLCDCFNGEETVRIHIFVASAFFGMPTETNEAKPMWLSVEDLPFERMWEEDSHWFPFMIAGKPFSGRFTYDKDWKKLLEYEVNQI
jgi:8-oxo-dGTP diphosphatase